MDKQAFVNRILAATQKELCDLVIKEVNIVDVFGMDTFVADVGIKDGYIVGIGSYEGKRYVEGKGKYICPSLIDGHAHIESSLVTPIEYFKAALIHGVTSIVADPHEIANVMGVEGIAHMIEMSKNLPFDFYYMMSSCVPATSLESSGAILNQEDLAPFYKDESVLGLAEVMDYPSVFNAEDKMIDKLMGALEKGLRIDGHGAGFNETMVNTYLSAGITTDHECRSAEEVVFRLRRGMYVLIREGTVAKNLQDLISVASINNSRRLCFCTDDKHIDDLIKEGSIDHAIRLAIENGVKPEMAIQMSTLNTAECYQLKHKGAIAPGFVADFILLDDLETFKIEEVYKNGKQVVKNGQLVYEEKIDNTKYPFHNSVSLPVLNKDSFKIDTNHTETIHVIEIIPNKLETNHLKLKSKEITSLLKIAVIERHEGNGNMGIGLVKGLGIESGAIGTTIAHDSHNMILCGTNDDDMLYAARQLEKMGGGIIVVKEQKVLAALPLELGGLMTYKKAEDVIESLDQLHKAVETIAPNISFNPFLTLSFLSLPVIPSLKITDRGLFDVEKFSYIKVVE
jgi:adenine deaminase